MIFEMHLRRRSLYSVVNVLVPSLIIGIVEAIIFIMPVEEISKVEISFTCLLAYSVFQSTVNANLPRTSTEMPLITMYITLQMAYIAFMGIIGEGVVITCLSKAKKKVKFHPYFFNIS